MLELSKERGCYRLIKRVTTEEISNFFGSLLLLQIEYSSEFISKSGKLSVYNALGKCLIDDNVYIRNGINTFSLNIENLSSGPYLINLKCNEIIFSKVFIKE